MSDQPKLIGCVQHDCAECQKDTQQLAEALAEVAKWSGIAGELEAKLDLLKAELARLRESEWRPIETLPYGVEAILWRRGTTPEISYWPGQPRNSDKEFPPTHWMPLPPPIEKAS